MVAYISSVHKSVGTVVKLAIIDNIFFYVSHFIYYDQWQR